MKLRHYTFFLRRNLRRRPGRTTTAVLAIAFGVGVFHLMVSLSLALHSQVLERIEAIFPERSILVHRRAVDFGPLAFSPKLLAPTMTPKTERRLSELAEVEAVWPMLPLRIPVMAQGNLAGYTGQTDVVVYGVPEGLVASDVVGQRGFSYRDPATSTVPVVVSRYFIDLFNLGMAESQGLPKLTDAAIIGKRFQLVLGISLLTVGTDAIDTSTLSTVDCEIVGLTRDPTLLGLIIPIEYVRRFDRRFLGPSAREEYVQMHVVLRSPQDYDEALRKIEEMGLEVSGRREMARRLRFAVTGGVAILLSFGLAVLGMAVVNIVNTFALIMLERRDEIGLLRAVGATRGAALGMLMGESVMLGLLGGLLGSGAAWAGGRLLNSALMRWIPPLSLTPDYWLDTRGRIFAACVALAAAGSALATAPLVWRSVRRWPAELLKEQ